MDNSKAFRERLRKSRAGHPGRFRVSVPILVVHYQRPFRRGSGPAYAHGLARATGSLGSASQNFILGTNLEFRPTETVHRRSSPKAV
jgi:hypothetical protein